MENAGVFIQASNPSDEERHNLLKKSLSKSGRLQDFNNIIKSLSPPPDILRYAVSGEFKKLEVGIIGGGLAGLSAAFELRKLGFNITIFDALEDRIGGRVYTYYFDQEKKHYGELGPMRIPVSHETTWHYINTFGLATDPFIQSNPNALIYLNNTRARNNPDSIKEKIYPKYDLAPWEKEAPWNKLYDYAFNYNMNSLHPVVRSEILKILPAYSPCYSELIDMSIRENLEVCGLSLDAINMIAGLDGLTGALYDISYNELLSENYGENFTYLYRIAGGNVNLPLAFYKSLTSNSPKEYKNIPVGGLGRITWKGGHFVTGIHKRDYNSEVLLEYKNKASTKGIIKSFDYVICAIPFSCLSTVDINPIFSNRKMQAIREINYVNAQRTLLYCKKRFWEENKDFGNINGGISFTDLPITNIVYPSNHISTGLNPEEPGVLVGSYNLNKYAVHLGSMEPHQIPELVKRNVEKAHGLPKYSLDSIVIDSKYINWNNEPWFRGDLAYFTPGQKRLFSNAIIKPEYNNRIFFAGEHTSATHAWMQGALHSGKLAANSLAYSAGKLGTVIQ